MWLLTEVGQKGLWIPQGHTKIQWCIQEGTPLKQAYTGFLNTQVLRNIHNKLKHFVAPLRIALVEIVTVAFLTQSTRNMFYFHYYWSSLRQFMDLNHGYSNESNKTWSLVSLVAYRWDQYFSHITAAATHGGKPGTILDINHLPETLEHGADRPIHSRANEGMEHTTSRSQAMLHNKLWTSTACVHCQCNWIPCTPRTTCIHNIAINMQYNFSILKEKLICYIFLRMSFCNT